MRQTTVHIALNYWIRSTKKVRGPHQQAQHPSSQNHQLDMVLIIKRKDKRNDPLSITELDNFGLQDVGDTF